jgi:hypothetical protein
VSPREPLASVAFMSVILPIDKLIVRLQAVERLPGNAMRINASFVVNNQQQYEKIIVPGSVKMQMKKNMAYEIGIDILKGRVPARSFFEISGTCTVVPYGKDGAAQD